MSPRIMPLDPATADGAVQNVFAGIKQSMGSVPNIFRTLAHAPSTLDAYVAFNGALSKGRLDRKLREQIAVAVAGFNSCGYCAAAHTYFGERTGVSADELSRNLRSSSNDPRTGAVLGFVRRLLEAHGSVADGDVAELREHGFDDGEIVEIVAHVGMNVFTNYFNLVAATEVDFPEVAMAS